MTRSEAIALFESLSHRSPEEVYRAFEPLESADACYALSSLPADLCNTLLDLEEVSMGTNYVNMMRDNIAGMKSSNTQAGSDALARLSSHLRRYLDGLR